MKNNLNKIISNILDKSNISKLNKSKYNRNCNESYISNNR